MTSVGLCHLVPPSRVFPIGFSADSAESARFLERWFNALGELDFAESSRGVVDTPSKRVRRSARTTDTSRRPPSALTYASSTPIVTFLDFSIATIRGCDTPMRSASSRCVTPARSRNAVIPAANRSSSSILATRFAAPSTLRTFFFPTFQTHDRFAFLVDFSVAASMARWCSSNMSTTRAKPLHNITVIERIPQPTASHPAIYGPFPERSGNPSTHQTREQHYSRFVPIDLTSPSVSRDLTTSIRP